MKNLILFSIYLLILWVNSFSQNNTLSPAVELYFGTESCNSTTTFTMTAQGTVWGATNDNSILHFYLGTQESFYNIPYTVPQNNTSPDTWSGFNIVWSQDYPGARYYGYGLYKVTINQSSANFYLDFKDCRYGNYSQIIDPPCYGQPTDIWIKYNAANNSFYYNSDAGNKPWVGPIGNGSKVNIWDIKHMEEPLTTQFEPYAPQNLSITIQNGLWPVLNWQHRTPADDFWTGYDIYRAKTQTTTVTDGDFQWLAFVSKDALLQYTDLTAKDGNWNYVHYKIKTKNGSVQSAFSNSVTFDNRISSNLTVSSGNTLTLPAGTYLKFLNGAAMIVWGTLNANGSSSNKITFDFDSDNSSTNNGIWFYNGSVASNINWATIKNAHYGCYMNNASPTINNTLFYHNYIGMYAYNSSSPFLVGNTFSYSTANGLHISNSSSPYLVQPGSCYGPGYNVITQNSMNGIYADYNSMPYLGVYPYGGYNSVFDNNRTNSSSYDVKTDASSYVTAQNNWWNGSPKIYLAQQVDTTHALGGSDPNAGRQLLGKSSTGNIASENSTNTDDDFINAMNLQMQGKYDDAISEFEKILNNPSKKALDAHSLIKISECYMKSGKKDFIDYLNKNIRSKYSNNSELSIISLEQENLWMLQDGKFNQVVKNTKKIRDDYPENKEAYKHSLFSELFTYHVYLKDDKKANEAFKELEAKYPADILVHDARVFLQQKIDGLAVTNGSGSNDYSNNQVIDSKATENTIANYPNPFNPSTRISFHLQKAGRVSLKVYDMLGKEVQTLVDEFKNEGNYSVEFNAKDLPSGVYIYVIRTDGFTASKKMILAK